MHNTHSSTTRTVSANIQTTEFITETHPQSRRPLNGLFGFLKSKSYSQTPTSSITTKIISSPATLVHVSQTQTPQLVTKSKFYPSYHELTLAQISQTSTLLRHPSPTHSQIPQNHFQQSFTFSFLPKFHLELSTIQQHVTPTQPPPSSITIPPPSKFDTQPSITKPTSSILTLPQTHPQSSPTKASVSTVHPRDHTTDLAKMDPENPVVRQVNISDQLNVTQQRDPGQSAKSANDTELTEWLKRNTSQSPMTSNDPR